MGSLGVGARPLAGIAPHPASHFTRPAGRPQSVPGWHRLCSQTWGVVLVCEGGQGHRSGGVWGIVSLLGLRGREEPVCEGLHGRVHLFGGDMGIAADGGEVRVP
jgi:hypothetical protein